MRYYADYFTVPENYKANMTREAINETPETWLDFYPHKKYERFLETLLDGFISNLSAWLFGNYGTGKSNAALVTQKLFMDDPVRVRDWFNRCASALSDRQALEATLFVCRDEGTLVVYDYNSSGIGPNEDFLVRLEKGIVAALNERKLIVPAKSNLTSIIARLEREDAHFFVTRDSIQSELAYLHTGIKSIKQLIGLLNEERKNTDTPTRLLDDVQRVFHKDNIFLNIDVPTFRAWVNAILDENSYARIVYIFDEFSEFIDENRAHLKTFEDVTENPGINRFFLVPVTHLELTAFVAEGSDSAKRSKDRFYPRNLQMPNDTAFKLAKHAMKDSTDPSVTEEWKMEKDNLYRAVSGIADKFNTTDASKDDYVSRQSFYDILPIHPMAAFLLKFLSESARSNQRSIFEYLKGSANGREFQDFIRTAGPGVANKQFLTVDYLWKYFIERDDLGINPEIIAIRSEYERIRNRDFSNQTNDASELRVLKTVLLFCLLERLSPDGHERLKPTVENAELSFKGDGAIINVGDIILGAIDYNPDGFARQSWIECDVWNAKHTMLTRLLPFIQPRINLIELAPQQTGKSYIFGKVGKYGWLMSGGNVSRTMLFLDRRSGARAKGLVTFNDFVAIDEVKSISFTNDKEMGGILKGYMEDGFATVGETRVDGEAGIIFLGNIAMEDMDASKDMLRELPDIFRDSALIQRIHGFVPGQYIPPLSPRMFISGWSLNTEYFTEIMHLLRSPAETMRYRGLAESLVEVSAKSGDTSGREQEAIMRLSTAYLKLFFPHADASLIKDIKFKQEFDQYCLSPAKRMQETVLRQMKIINPGMFGNTGFATYKVRYSDAEKETPIFPQMRERMVINEE